MQHRLALVPLLLVLGACGRSASDRPNVLLISIDSLRADHVGCYGYGRNTSPAIDRIAREGARFEEHVSSSSWTLPAHAALFTGLPDSGHGCVDVDRMLAPHLETVAERFTTHGYDTAGFYAGPFLHPVFGFGQGFERYVDCTSTSEERDAADAIDWDASTRDSHADVANPRTFAAFEEWFDRRDDEPFFAFVHLWDVHYDFTPPPPYDELFDPHYEGWVDGRDFFFDARIGPDMAQRDLDHLVALYDGEIAWTDSYVDKIRALLEEAGELDSTIVVITSDHGSEFFEHGAKGHRTSLYDEVIHVPLVVRYPATIPAGTVVEAQSRSIDIAPTLLDLCGLGTLEDVAGVSLLDLVRDAGGARGPGRPAVSELDTLGYSLLSVRTRRAKAIGNRNSSTVDVYDLSADPGERRPLHDARSPLVEDGLRSLDEAGTELTRLGRAHAGDATRGELPIEVQRHLDDLGYTGDDR